MVPQWLHVTAWIFVSLGFVCAGIIAVDVVRHPQQMWIMNIVWPVTALFGTFISVWGYFRYGRLASIEAVEKAKARGERPPNQARTPFSVKAGKGAAHCGSGCTLGDIVAEWLAFLVPTIAVWFGWRSIFGDKMFAVWIFDYLVAFAFGVAFQYFTIAPMRNLGPVQGIVQAVKADFLSLTSWQVGMYGFMAIAQFLIFRPLFHVRLEPNSAEFWFMMQIAMMAGFVTAYPVNWWLIRKGIKEEM